MLSQEDAIVFIRHIAVGLTCALALCTSLAATSSSRAQDSHNAPESGVNHDDAAHEDAAHEDAAHKEDASSHGEDLPNPGHGNATGWLTRAEEVKSDLAIFSLVVFLLLLAILLRFAWGPIVEGLDKREAAVAANIKQAVDNAAK